MRRQTDYIALWPAFGITPDIREKLMRISPAAVDRALKNDRAALALKGKSLTKSAGLIKYRIPIRTFHAFRERKLPGSIRTFHGSPLRTGRFRPVYHHPHRHRCRFRLDLPVFPPLPDF
jgi:hypothetical protein